MKLDSCPLVNYGFECDFISISVSGLSMKDGPPKMGRMPGNVYMG